jgi:leader peptidase (prepilin peptidase) / N-methyltransferase
VDETVAPGARALLDSPLGLVAAGVFGALWGSFYNVCIARIPRGESVVRPASHCGACNRPVRPLDNIPILSYLLLRGRCRDCGTHFSARYALIELLGAATSLVLFWKLVLLAPELPVSVSLARYATGFAFTGVLIVLSFIDLDTKRLPDVITLPSIPVFFLAGFATDIPWLERLIGAAVGYLAVRLIADGYYYLTGREGLGLGDGKLLAVIGALLGWRALPPIIFAASFVGVLVSIPLLLLQRRRDQKAAATAAASAAPAPAAVSLASATVAGSAPSTTAAGSVPTVAAPSVPTAAPSVPTAAAASEPAASPASVPGISGDQGGAVHPAAPPDGEADTPVIPLRRTEVPFGPFLSLSAFVYLIAGREIQAAVLHWLSGGGIPLD